MNDSTVRRIGMIRWLDLPEHIRKHVIARAS